MHITLAVAIVPALLLIWLFVKLDKKRPEPKGKVRNAMIFGALTCIPAAFIELAIEAVLGPSIVQAQGQVVRAFLVAGFVEETLKLSVVLLYVWKKPYFDEVMDGIVYVVAASLGFALLENVMYSAGNLVTGLLRAFTAVPMHAICSGIMGYFVGRAKMAPSAKVGWLALGLSVGVFIHGLYDWILFSGGTFGFAAPIDIAGLLEIIPLLIVIGVVLHQLIKDALRRDAEIHGPESRPVPLSRAGAYPAHPNYYPNPYAWYPTGQATPQWSAPGSPAAYYTGPPNPYAASAPHHPQHPPAQAYPQQPHQAYPQQPHQAHYPQHQAYPQQPHQAYPQHQGSPQQPRASPQEAHQHQPASPQQMQPSGAADGRGTPGPEQ